MYKVMILDDEKIVRLALKTMIRWEDFGFEITGSFGSAHAALEAARADPPDLIITDIAMPDMDGLRFIGQLRGSGIACQIIVLTNHENFSYAVDAIRQGVMDYVIKTDISPESLAALIKTARDKIAERPRTSPDHPDKGGRREEDLALLRRALEEEIPARALSEPYSLCLAFLDRPAAGQAAGMETGFYNLLCENLGRPDGTLLPCGPDQTAVLLSTREEADFLPDAALQCQRIHAFSKAYLNVPCGFLLSGSFVDPASFLRELEQCRQSIPHAVFSGLGRLTRLADIRRLSAAPLPVSALCGQISASLDGDDFPAAKEVFFSFLSGPDLRAAALGPAREAVRGVCLSVLLEQSPFLAPEERRALWEQLRQCRTLDAFRSHFIDTVHLTAQRRTRLKAFSSNDRVAPIISFIDRNISRHISLSMISQNIHMTENYISRLFKAETGINIVSYINAAKMAQGRLLLAEPQSTVQSVAAALGYFETSYFIRLFKRIYGVGPSEYKRFLKTRAADTLLGPPQ
ncbi:response regulator [uncultured Anaerotruncus sp.]|uniref:response regulator n=1 Tax=uncultured Anaerotruncus sp. TaxID=905011 RepID=UPI00280AA282|nr:response regulator [uncultured Anaerotruncus sp.]